MLPKVRPLKTLHEAARGHVGMPISVCAWVTWFSLQRQSNGKDHYMLLHLSDPSLTEEDMRFLRAPSMERVPGERLYVTCAFFGPQHLLPQLAPGDPPRIIYLHQTKFTRYKGELQLRVTLRTCKTPQDGDTYSLYGVPALAPVRGPGAQDEEVLEEEDEDADGQANLLAPISESHPGDQTQAQVDLKFIKKIRRWVVQQVQAQVQANTGGQAARLPAPATPVVLPAVAAPAAAAQLQVPPAMFVPGVAMPAKADPAAAVGPPALPQAAGSAATAADSVAAAADQAARAAPGCPAGQGQVDTSSRGQGLRWIRELLPPLAPDGSLLRSKGTRRKSRMPTSADLLCRVLAVDFCRYPHYYVLHVWDGSDAHPVPPGYTSAPIELRRPPQQLRQPSARQQQQEQSQQRKRSKPEEADHDGTPGGSDLQAPKRQRVNATGGTATAGAAAEAARAAAEAAGVEAETAGAEAEAAPRGGAAAGDLSSKRLPARWPCLLPPPHSCRLHMPLSSIAQFSGNAKTAAALAVGPGGNGGGGSSDGDSGCVIGWEVLSAVVARDQMPATGSSVPLVLPGALFQLAPPPPPPSGGPPQAEAEAEAAAQGPSTVPPQPLPRPGDWIKLSRVLPIFVRGQLQLGFRKDVSRLVPRQQRAREVAEAEEQGAARVCEERLRCRGAGPWRIAPPDPEAWLARAVRSWQGLPLRTLRQVLMQQDTCDCTPARVLVRVMAVRNPPLPPALPALIVPAGAGNGDGDDGSESNGGGRARAEVRRALRRAMLPAAALKAQEEVVGTPLDRTGDGRSYALSLQLQDATASLRAVVVGGAANLLLWDLSSPGAGGDGRAASASGKSKASQPHPPQPQPPQPEQTQQHQVQAAAEAQQTPALGPAPAGTPSTRIMTRARAKSVSFAPEVHTARPHTRAATRTATAAATPPPAAVAAATASALEAATPVPSAAQAPQPAAVPAPATGLPVAVNTHRSRRPSREFAGEDVAGSSTGSADLDIRERLVAALRWLSNQRVPGGAWMEAVLRPMYGDRNNPWQSAVYTLEHTVLRLPPHLAARAEAGAPTATDVIEGRL